MSIEELLKKPILTDSEENIVCYHVIGEMQKKMFKYEEALKVISENSVDPLIVHISKTALTEQP
ncbi:hypothetical protein ABEY43_07000 [Priestia megaterium]